MNDELPTTPGAAFSLPKSTRDPLVEIEIDRRAATLDGIETQTCVQCGVAKASVRGAVHVAGRRSSIDLRVAVCDSCRAQAHAAYAKVGRFQRVVRGVYFAQLAALGLSIAGGGGGFLFSSLSVLLVGTLGASYFARKRLLRAQPRLLSIGPTSLRLVAPRSWARVLLDEKPHVLVGDSLVGRSATTPAAALPESPR